MRVALVPMKVKVGDLYANVDEFEDSLERVMDYTPDLVVFPEYFLTGFKMWDLSPAMFYDDILAILKYKAEFLRVHLAGGVLELSGGCVYNSAVLVSPSGRVLLKHRKFQEPVRFCSGDRLKMVRTRWGRLSMIICGDLYNEKILMEIRRRKPDYLLVPMEYSPPYGPLNEEDVRAMSERVRLFGSITLVVNSFPPGGAWVFGRSGELLLSSSGNHPLIADV